MTISLRLPEELHEALGEIARTQDRSLTGQIIRFLREAAERELGPGALEERRRRREQPEGGQR